MTEIEFDFRFRAGQCTLHVTTQGEALDLTCHWINDRFNALLKAVDALLSGTEAVCCRWPGPVQEGHYIDLVRDPDGGVNLAITAFPFADGATAEEIWSARRGLEKLVCRASIEAFAIGFATALRAVRTKQIDAGGLLHEYPRPFPYSTFENIEEAATRWGYKPHYP